MGVWEGRSATIQRKTRASLSPLFNPSWRFLISIFQYFLQAHFLLYTHKFLCSLEFCLQPSFLFPLDAIHEQSQLSTTFQVSFVH